MTTFNCIQHDEWKSMDEDAVKKKTKRLTIAKKVFVKIAKSTYFQDHQEFETRKQELDASGNLTAQQDASDALIMSTRNKVRKSISANTCFSVSTISLYLL
ncbi:hypothetical protein PsorP6_003587 [Peronosclerospora sorghi]|uniref:Uncharacterized protein n=1 Tax=Peronosclerospora sorghi TaxID=230839 RepID=A0ACC0VR55_9STRA|nr:hypothetical protein PsorP6_003587 [Peronosclerospora sorghi]